MLENESLEDFEGRVEEICLKLLADAEKAEVSKDKFYILLLDESLEMEKRLRIKLNLVNKNN